ncbi:MAG: hypothetical protein ACXW3D_04005 [Caulobacteraceae bacterium]
MKRLVFLAAALLLAASQAQATVTPIQGTDVGLEHDPVGLMVHTTDSKGDAVFSGLAPGRYSVFIDGNGWLSGPVTITARVKGGETVVSAPLLLSRTKGRVYALDKSGAKLVLVVPAGKAALGLVGLHVVGGGKGRALKGNDNEWRYVPVRR